jgi:hypothetical protein
MGEWCFNRDYGDLDQVAPFLTAFMEVLADLESEGKCRYNGSFKGRIPGIEGPCEDTAIYLLQGLERENAQDAEVARLIGAGYAWLDEVAEPRRRRRVVLVPARRDGGEWASHFDARVIGRGGRPYAALPKGRRTRGHLVMGRRVLVSAP